MITIPIPYHREKMELHIDENNLKQVLEPRHIEGARKGSSLVMEALVNPIDTPRLSELAREKRSALIITSDHTRAMPSKITLPILLAELRSNNPGIDITILIGTGLHRSTTRDEMIDMFGADIVNNEKIRVHNAFDSLAMQQVCQLPSGAEFAVNKLIFENELVVTEGFIEPHFFAGFSGGRKSILPGIASAVTVRQNHCATAIGNIHAKAGILKGNPIHEDMMYAALHVPVSFCLNVVMDQNKNIIGAFAGDISRAHLRGCEFLMGLASVSKVTSDIVIASNSGYPLDQNLYQSAKGMSNAASCAGEDGVIIMVSSCCDGMGGDEFSELMLSGTPREIYDFIMDIPAEKSISEQWCAQIVAQILLKHPVILVTRHMDHELIKKLYMIPASTVDEALEMAYSIKGRRASVTVLPDGVAVIIKE
jgi:lactate racemase